MNTDNFGENTRLWLDRLACGELDENTRKSLFIWLDAEPLRWRACALSFLEAQTWNESLADVEEKAPALSELAPVAMPNEHYHQAEFRWTSLTSLAVALLVAFSLGAFSGSWWKSNDVVEQQPPAFAKQPLEVEPSHPLMATVSFHPELSSGMPATLQIPVRTVQDLADEPAGTPISEYDRQKWERRGYQLIKERRFLPAELPGGKKVVVPVEQIKASYVGSKVS